MAVWLTDWLIERFVFAFHLIFFVIRVFCSGFETSRFQWTGGIRCVRSLLKSIKMNTRTALRVCCQWDNSTTGGRICFYVLITSNEIFHWTTNRQTRVPLHFVNWIGWKEYIRIIRYECECMCLHVRISIAFLVRQYPFQNRINF